MGEFLTLKTPLSFPSDLHLGEGYAETAGEDKQAYFCTAFQVPSSNYPTYSHFEAVYIRNYLGTPRLNMSLIADSRCLVYRNGAPKRSTCQGGYCFEQRTSKRAECNLDSLPLQGL